MLEVGVLLLVVGSTWMAWRWRSSSRVRTTSFGHPLQDGPDHEPWVAKLRTAVLDDAGVERLIANQQARDPSISRNVAAKRAVEELHHDLQRS